MSKYISKHMRPQRTLEAHRFTGDFEAVKAWATANELIDSLNQSVHLGGDPSDAPYLLVHNLDGKVRCKVGDYLVDTPVNDFHVICARTFEGRFKPAQATAAVTGLSLIKAQVEKQIRVKGYDAAHDDTHTKGELLLAAQCYLRAALPNDKPYFKGNERRDLIASGWPFEPESLKVGGSAIKDLTRAAALIVAEIERLQRLEPSTESAQEKAPAVTDTHLLKVIVKGPGVKITPVYVSQAGPHNYEITFDIAQACTMPKEDALKAATDHETIKGLSEVIVRHFSKAVNGMETVAEPAPEKLLLFDLLHESGQILTISQYDITKAFGHAGAEDPIIAIETQNLTYAEASKIPDYN